MQVSGLQPNIFLTNLMDMTKEEDNNNKMEENGDTEQNGDSGDSDLELDCGDGDLLLCHTHQGNKGHKTNPSLHAQGSILCMLR